MRPRLIALLLVVIVQASATGTAADLAAFDRAFHDATLRVDFHHSGDARTEEIALDRLFRQGTWAGSRVHLVDASGLGRYAAELADPATGAVLFRRRFDSYFGEYKTTDRAIKGVRRTYHETVLMPMPRGEARLTIKVRRRDGSDSTLIETTVDPNATTLSREPAASGVKVFPLVKGGDPHAMVDVAIVAEGYTAAEEPKLKADLDRFAGILFDHEPFRAMKARFNVSGVWRPSPESGCDEPGRGVWKETPLGVGFDALGLERYMLTEDNRALREIAANVPYDAIYIMVNHARYGGGGIYNLYCAFTADNQWSPYVFIHEFGHSFAGLADEYYTSNVAYNDFYPAGVEPAEPNITALLDPARLKWADLVAPGTPIPTPWPKAAFDGDDLAYQAARERANAAIAEAIRTNAPAAEVARLKDEAERLSRERANRADADLAATRFAGKVGAFEGAGYAAKGLYRPSPDCIMFSKGGKPFCPVCDRAIRRAIESYGEGG